MFFSAHLFRFVCFFLVLCAAWAPGFLGSVYAAQETPPIRVLEVRGPAEVLEPSVRRWVKLKKSASLREGVTIRTGENASTQLVFDKDLETAVQVAENSRLGILRGRNFRICLEKGRIFVLREGDAEGALEIHARHLEVRMHLGGVILDASKQRVFVRVYGDDVFFKSVAGRQVKQGSIPEGYQYRRRSPDRTGRIQRMSYPDYLDWQAWVRKWYEMRDDHYAERLEKEMGS